MRCKRYRNNFEPYGIKEKIIFIKDFTPSKKITLSNEQGVRNRQGDTTDAVRPTI